MCSRLLKVREELRTTFVELLFFKNITIKINRYADFPPLLRAFELMFTAIFKKLLAPFHCAKTFLDV